MDDRCGIDKGATRRELDPLLPPEWVVEAQVPARVSVVGRKEDRHRKVLPHRRYAIHDRIHVRAIAIPHAIP